MRTRTGWLAVLLTTGLALAPTRGQAQAPEGPANSSDQVPWYSLPYVARAQFNSPTNDYDVPFADPQMPLPVGHDRMENGGLFTAFQFMFWRQTNPLQNQLIAVRGLVDFDGSIHQDIQPGQSFQTLGGQTFAGQGVILPGGFIGSGQPALSTGDVAGPQSWAPGWDFTIGWRFAEGWTLAFDWIHIFNVRYIGGATLVPQGMQPGQLLENSFLYSPVYNFPNTYAGPAEKIALGNPLAAFGIWNGASEMDLRFDQRLSEYDIGSRIPIVESDCYRCYGLAGVRRVNMWENFKWRTVSYDFQGLADASDAAIYNNIVSNQMYGGYCGCGSECYLGHGFSIAFETRACALLDFVHAEAHWQRGDLATEAKRSERIFSAVPELDAKINLWWYPIEGVECHVGYSMQNFFNTIASPQPVSFNFDGLDPPWVHKVWRLVDGVEVGMGFVF